MQPIDIRLVHGSAPVLVGETPAAVAFERRSVVLKHSFAVDPEVGWEKGAVD